MSEQVDAVVVGMGPGRRGGRKTGRGRRGRPGCEVLGMLTLAVQAQVPLDTLRHMIYAYPTFHRGVEDALRATRV